MISLPRKHIFAWHGGQVDVEGMHACMMRGLLIDWETNTVGAYTQRPSGRLRIRNAGLQMRRRKCMDGWGRHVITFTAAVAVAVAVERERTAATSFSLCTIISCLFSWVLAQIRAEQQCAHTALSSSTTCHSSMRARCKSREGATRGCSET